MNMLSVQSLACILIASALAGAQSTVLWDNYDKVMAKRLTDTFNATSTLSAAYDLEMTQGNSAIKYGCSNYTDGSAIVDFERDFMCFMVIQKPDSIEDFSSVFEWIGPALAPLKIHDSIYKFVESSAADFNWGPAVVKDLTLFFRGELFEGSIATDHFSEVVKSVTSYELTPFDSFFWTSDKANTLFRSPSESQESAEDDHQREEQWQGIAQTFKHYVLPDKDKDPCLFEELRDLDLVDGHVVLPLERLLGLGDRPVVRACIAYLAAVMSQEQSVNHVALTARPQVLNFRSRSIQEVARVGSWSGANPYTMAGLRGDGQVVTVADTGLDIYSCYFYDPQGHVPFSDISNPVYDSKYRKVVMYAYSGSSDKSDEAGGHGTHVCGTAAGSIAGADITTDGIYDGVAPNAKIAFMDLGTPGSGLAIPSTSTLYGDGYKAGARVHTNSWGNYFSGSGYYCSHNNDDVLYNNKNFMIFFAAGNAGGNGDGTSTITMDASGKNMIAVGSSETTLDTPNINYVAWYSSKGPVYDNRIKPDLVAPGDQLMSARASGNGQQTCSTIEMTGTSMASPSAAGSALLVRQYFMDTNTRFWTKYCYVKYRTCKAFTPSGSLTRAILLHSVSPMSLFNGGGSYDVPLGPPPDYMQGFGRNTLKNVLPLFGQANFDLFVEDLKTINQYSQINYVITIPNTAYPKPLKVTLAWYDPPNVDGTTSKALLQNLDLKLVSPTGQVFYPNRRSSADTLNTVEHTEINPASSGVWKVSVSSQSLPSYGQQQFSLVITSNGKVSYA